MDGQMHAECLCWALLSPVLLQLYREVGRRGQQSPGSQVWCEGQSAEGTQQGRRDAERGEAAAWRRAQCVQGPGNGVCKGQSRGSQVWTSVCGRLRPSSALLSLGIAFFLTGSI